MKNKTEFIDIEERYRFAEGELDVLYVRMPDQNIVYAANLN